MLNGIDISNVNGPVNWAAWRGKIDFAWVKVTEGTFFADQQAAHNIAMARRTGLMVGGYHFLHNGDGVHDGAHQAEYFLSHAHAAGLRPGDLIAVDAEDEGLDGGTPEHMDLVAAGFNNRLRREHYGDGFNAFLYTELHLTTAFAHCGNMPLWLANPSGITVKACGPWKQVSMEQTGQRGVDTDVFYGDLGQLKKLAVPARM